jgi:alcohol dehydrogenase
MIAKALGAKVLAIDINPDALNKAFDLGADYAIDSSLVNPVTTIQELSGIGAHVSIDALGSEVTAKASVLSLRRRGRHLQLGLLLTPNGETPMPMSRVIGWEIDLLGSHGMAAVDYPKMLEMVQSGKLQPQNLIEREVSLGVGANELGQMEHTPNSGITIITPQS